MDYSRASVLALQHCDITPFRNIILTPGDVREAVRRGINLRGVSAVVWHVAPDLMNLIPNDDDLYGDRIDDEDAAVEA